jgi:hypothetical protein
MTTKRRDVAKRCLLTMAQTTAPSQFRSFVSFAAIHGTQVVIGKGALITNGMEFITVRLANRSFILIGEVISFIGHPIYFPPVVRRCLSCAHCSEPFLLF